MKGNVCRMEVRALSSSKGDTLVPRSHRAECCGQIQFPRELSLLAVLWHWDSSHALAAGPGIPSAWRDLTQDFFSPAIPSPSSLHDPRAGCAVVLPDSPPPSCPRMGGECPPCCSPSQPPTPSVQGGSPAGLCCEQDAVPRI